MIKVEGVANLSYKYHRFSTLVACCSIFVTKLVNWKRNRSRTCYKENKWLLEVMRSIFRELKTLRCRSVHLNQLPPHCRNFVSLEYMICSKQVSMTVLIFDRSSTPLLLHSVRPRVRCKHFQMAGPRAPSSLCNNFYPHMMP
jgi:hypothetical protein